MKLKTNFWSSPDPEYWRAKYAKLGKSLALFGLVNFLFGEHGFLTYFNLIPIIGYALLLWSKKKYEKTPWK